MNGLENGAWGLDAAAVEQLATTDVPVGCGWWTWPFC